MPNSIDKVASLQFKLDTQYETDVIEFLSGMRKTDKHGVVVQALRMMMQKSGFYEKQLIREKYGSHHTVPLQAVKTADRDNAQGPVKGTREKTKDAEILDMQEMTSIANAF